MQNRVKFHNTTIDLESPSCARQSFLLSLGKGRREGVRGNGRKAKSLTMAKDPLDRQSALGETMLKVDLTKLPGSLPWRVALFLEKSCEGGKKLCSNKLFVSPSDRRSFAHLLSCLQKCLLQLAQHEW